MSELTANTLFSDKLDITSVVENPNQKKIGVYSKIRDSQTAFRNFIQTQTVESPNDKQTSENDAAEDEKNSFDLGPVNLLEKWDGYVTEISEDGFTAAFWKTDSDEQELMAEFSFDEITEEDRDILLQGMPLIWSITSERRNGGLTHCSTLIIRRQPVFKPSTSSPSSFSRKIRDWLQ